MDPIKLYRSCPDGYRKTFGYKSGLWQCTKINSGPPNGILTAEYLFSLLNDSTNVWVFEGDLNELLLNMPPETNTAECDICFDDKVVFKITCCKNKKICESCIKILLGSSCPFCTQTLVKGTLFHN